MASLAALRVRAPEGTGGQLKSPSRNLCREADSIQCARDKKAESDSR